LHAVSNAVRGEISRATSSSHPVHSDLKSDASLLTWLALPVISTRSRQTCGQFHRRRSPSLVAVAPPKARWAVIEFPIAGGPRPSRGSSDRGRSPYRADQSLPSDFPEEFRPSYLSVTPPIHRRQLEAHRASCCCRSRPLFLAERVRNQKQKTVAKGESRWLASRLVTLLLIGHP
jgi:hypothetical protein